MTSEQFSDWYKEWLVRATKLSAQPPSLQENEQQQLRHIYHHSPYLRKLLLKHPDIFVSFINEDIQTNWQHITALLNHPFSTFVNQAELSKHLRHIKQRAALLIALADINERWDLDSVTLALSQLAEQSVELVLAFLLSTAHNKQEITLAHPDQPTKASGIIVLGMGKLGAYELNYSSDIDLIIFFEPGRLNYQGRHNEQHFLNKLAQELANIMQERTADGYVFRTDLRLRPDPSSTPLAVSIDGALQYYENLGQNWERAAMIKARAIAGDLDAGYYFLQSLGPYIWRKSLDFASIQDILSIKRQISKKIGIQEHLYGHNIKLGKGGIREIEFFVQLHQLIWGGRQKELRQLKTLGTLATLHELEHITEEQYQLLTNAYQFYRKLEHRLQMVEDHQTHTLPEDKTDFANIATFMGYKNPALFEEQLKYYVSNVHEIFTESFETEGLYAAEGNLVFTGTNHDPETLETLRNMGFTNAETVSQTIMDWHRGSRRCTRSKVARRLLTELVPNILKALSNTVHPDDAFIKFDQFLLALPVGVQLFSLISQNPHLLYLIADIMGTSPTLSKTLSRRPELIETALFTGFEDQLPAKSELQNELEEELRHIEFYDAAMEKLRQFKNEKHFQAGTQLLRHVINTDTAGQYLSNIADILIHQVLTLTLNEFTNQYGTLENGRCCIIALGKLGSQDLTFGSDVDLMFVYDSLDSDANSDDKIAHTPSVYYNRLSQRLVSALTAIGTNGALYDVDTRLRPSGEQGLLAVSKQTLTHYFSQEAWTFERMALCKARAIAGDTSLQEEVEQQIHTILSQPRDIESLRQDVTNMRKRVEDEYGTDTIWDLKHVAGGLMDIDFVAQYLLLALSYRYTELYTRRSRNILEAAAANSKICQELSINSKDLDTLVETSKFLTQLQHLLRLTSENTLILENPPAGLAELLADAMQLESYDTLKETLKHIEQRSRKAYIGVMEVN